MDIKKAIVNYGKVIEIRADYSEMSITTEGEQITLMSDELAEIVRLAKFLQWEHFDELTI